MSDSPATGWTVWQPFPHVVPENDLREHTLDTACWCCPTDDAGVYVHHSADQRERERLHS